MSAFAANEAKASEPLGVETLAVVVLLLLLANTGAELDEDEGTVAEAAGVTLVCTLTDDAGLEATGGWLLAHSPPEPEFRLRSFVSIAGLRSAGIRIRIGLAGSTYSPR